MMTTISDIGTTTSDTCVLYAGSSIIDTEDIFCRGNSVDVLKFAIAHKLASPKLGIEVASLGVTFLTLGGFTVFIFTFYINVYFLTLVSMLTISIFVVLTDA